MRLLRARHAVRRSRLEKRGAPHTPPRAITDRPKVRCAKHARWIARDQDACYYLGLASYNLGRYENAIEAYRKALKAAGRAARVRCGLGLALEALGRGEEAERELRGSIKIEDGKSIADFDPRVELGAFLYPPGSCRRSAQRASRPQSRLVRIPPRAFFELARVLVQYGRLEDAVGRLTEAVRLDPTYGAAHLLLGQGVFPPGPRSGRGTANANRAEAPPSKVP